MFVKPTLAISVGCLLLTCVDMTTAEEVSLDDIVAAWKQSQDRVRSGEIEWTTQLWMARGALQSAETPPFDSEAPVPEEDVTFDYKRKLVFRDGLVRYEDDGPHWDSKQEQFVSRRTIYTWNGEFSTKFNGDNKWPYAFIDKVNRQLTGSQVRPIQFAFRMFHPEWYVFDPQKFEIVNRNENIDGLECIIVETASKLLEEKVSRGRLPLKAVFWVCPDRDYSIIRYAAVNESTGDSTLQFGLRHEFEDEAQAWVPIEWTITHSGEKGPFKVEQSTVENYAINLDIPDDTFDAQIPQDTMVTDHRTGEDYIHRANGEKRVVTQEELLRGATYEEFVQTETGEAGLRQSEASGIFSSPVTYIWAIGILLLLLAGFFLYRQKMS